MGSLLFEFAFTPASWGYITDAKILKQAGSINIEDMRFIQLMHLEYLINNKLVCNEVLFNAETCNAIAEEQHGSRKHHHAGLLVLKKGLVVNLFKYTHQFRCYGMNDTNDCFEQIQYHFAVLV